MSSSVVLGKLQVWRLFTNFFFFGAISLDFFFHMFFLVRYCRMLEEGSFRGRPADFLLMLLFGGALMCAVAPFINIPPFLGSSLAFMMVLLSLTLILTLTLTLTRTRTCTLTLTLTLTLALALTLTLTLTLTRSTCGRGATSTCA